MCNGILRSSRPWSSTTTSSGFGSSSLRNSERIVFRIRGGDELDTNAAAKSAMMDNPIAKLEHDNSLGVTTAWGLVLLNHLA